MSDEIKLDATIEKELLNHLENEVEYLENPYYKIIDNGSRICIEGNCHITQVNKLLEDLPFMKSLLNAEYLSFYAFQDVNQIIFEFK